MPDAFWDANVGVKINDLLGDHARLAAAEAARQSQDLARPKKPEEFKFGLSENFKPPQGIEFKLDENDPMVAQYRNFAVKHRLDQGAFTEGLDMLAAIRLGEETEFRNAKAAEVQKLGVNGTARVDAVTRWMTAVAGDKAKALVSVLSQVPVASTIEAFEALINKFQNQGGSAFTAAHRELPAPPPKTLAERMYPNLRSETRN